MGKNNIGLALCAVLLALTFPTLAQQQAKVAKIGWLAMRPASAGGQEVIRRMLREIGYVEGKNIAFEDRFADDSSLGVQQLVCPGLVVLHI
jgi:hypothetical protein